MRYLLLSIAFFLSGSLPAQEAVDAPGISGTLTWKGARFGLREVLWPEGVRNNDVILERILVGKKVLDRSLVVDPDSGGIADCAVFLDGVEIGAKQSAIVQVDIQTLQFNHRVVVLRPQGKLRVRNMDARGYVLEIHYDNKVLRMVEVPKESTIDLSLPEEGVTEIVARGLPFMRTTVHHAGWKPALITGPDGEFSVRGLRAGPARLSFFHEVLGRCEVAVEVLADGATELKLDQTSFSAFKDPQVFPGLESKEHPLLRINGHGVGKKAFDRVLQFVRRRYDDFEMPDVMLKRYIIDGVLIPLVASMDHHAEAYEALKEQGAVISRALAGGKTLRDAAKAAGAAYLPGEGRWFGRRDVEPWLGSRVFSSPKNLPVGPFVGPRGMHFLLVTDTNGRGGAETRRFSQVFLPFAPGIDAASMDRRIRELARRARVEALDSALKPLIPQQNSR